MRSVYKILAGLVFCCMFLVGCQKQPQQVRFLNAPAEEDTVKMAQLKFNMYMASAADELCTAWVQADSLDYQSDDFGFWYATLVDFESPLLVKGSREVMHLQMYELNGEQLADVEDAFVVGASALPLAVNNMLEKMGRGDAVQIVAPWYTAYGVEGTEYVKPYTNLIIKIEIQ